MRSFEERVAEINRRSEKILQDRKTRRKHILFACVPLVLCIGFCAAFILPNGSPAKDTAPENVTEAPKDGMAAGSLVCSYETVHIQSPAYARTVTDRASVAKIYGAILDIYPEESDAIASGQGNKGSATDGRGEQIYGQAGGYGITFTTADGTEDVYVLQGNVLEKLRTGETVALTAEQQYNLYAALGLES